MAVVLSDPALYRYTGGSPPSSAELEQQYRRKALGPWPPDERWLNWVVRTPDQAPVGYLQATVTMSQQQAAPARRQPVAAGARTVDLSPPAACGRLAARAVLAAPASFPTPCSATEAAGSGLVGWNVAA